MTADERFYTITQASRLVGVKAHVLRYWEKEFRWLSPKKNSAGRRVYSDHDIELARLISRLVHQEGYSIQGARKRIKTLYSRSEQMALPLSEANAEALEQIKNEIREVLRILERPGGIEEEH